VIDDVVAAVRSVLQQGGSLPSERVLARKINVKRHQVRRALEVLREANEIESAGARRAAASLDRRLSLARDTNPIEVIELRMALEPALARLAALRASPVEIARIQRAALAEQGDSGANDLAFHKAVAAGARNTLAAGIYFLLREIGRDARLSLRSNAPVCPKRLQQRNAEHRAVAAAIAARDADAAERAMRAHLAKVHGIVLSRLSPQFSIDTQVTQ
jgi:GntR family transcriptional regulator, transcriptional repressor for pyruvate dehydrogenase complex